MKSVKNFSPVRLPLPASVKRTSPLLSQSFCDRADRAAFWEAWVSATLRRCGLYVLSGPFGLAQTQAEKDEYANRYDLEVSADGLFCCPVEVKSCYAPKERVMVSSLLNWQKKSKKSDVTTTHFLSVCTRDGEIVWFPKGTPVLIETMHDISRNEIFKCVTVSWYSGRPVEDFVSEIKNQGY